MVSVDVDVLIMMIIKVSVDGDVLIMMIVVTRMVVVAMILIMVTGKSPSRHGTQSV